MAPVRLPVVDEETPRAAGVVGVGPRPGGPVSSVLVSGSTRTRGWEVVPRGQPALGLLVPGSLVLPWPTSALTAPVRVSLPPVALPVGPFFPALLLPRLSIRVLGYWVGQRERASRGTIFPAPPTHCVLPPFCPPAQPSDPPHSPASGREEGEERWRMGGPAGRAGRGSADPGGAVGDPTVGPGGA